MKTYFLITYVIDAPKKPIKSAIIGVNIDNSNSLITDLAELAFKKVEQKYPDNKLHWIDYTCISHSIEFIDV